MKNVLIILLFIVMVVIILILGCVSKLFMFEIGEIFFEIKINFDGIKLFVFSISILKFEGRGVGGRKGGGGGGCGEGCGLCLDGEEG